MSDSLFKKKGGITILVAPLDWGLGHATRCIPLIQFLIQLGCKVIIAAEGAQEKLLKSEFPDTSFVSIPGYNIKYTNVERFFIGKIILQLPKIFITIYKEKRWLNSFLKNNSINAVISDNRYGLFHHKVTSVFITHQLLIKTSYSFIEKILQKINYKYIKKFAMCWVPDEKGQVNLAGKLSHPAIFPAIPVTYIGSLSRLEKHIGTEQKSSLLIILSGPEPQRTFLEKLILAELINFKGKVLLVRGLPGSSTELFAADNVTIKNHLGSKELEKAFNECEYIISRSGYTTVMDICKLKKKSILIPTPSQTEQEYLAAHLQKQNWCVSVLQRNFSLFGCLAQAEHFKYNLPDLTMTLYQEVLTDFVDNLKKKVFE